MKTKLYLLALIICLGGSLIAQPYSKPPYLYSDISASGNYDFTGKKLTAICTSGGSDIGTSADYLQKLTKGQANWKPGKLLSPRVGEQEIKSWFAGLGF